MANKSTLPMGKYFAWVEQGGSLHIPYRMRALEKYQALFPYIDKQIVKDSIRLGAVLTLIAGPAIILGWLFLLGQSLGIIRTGESPTATPNPFVMFSPSPSPTIAVVVSPTPTRPVYGFVPTYTPVSTQVVSQRPTLSPIPFTSSPTITPSPTVSPIPTFDFEGQGQPVVVRMRSFYPDKTDGRDCYRYDFDSNKCLSSMAAKEYDWRVLFAQGIPVAACPLDWLRHALYIPEMQKVVYCLDTSISWACGDGNECLIALLTPDSSLADLDMVSSAVLSEQMVLPPDAAAGGSP